MTTRQRIQQPHHQKKHSNIPIQEINQSRLLKTEAPINGGRRQRNILNSQKSNTQRSEYKSVPSYQTKTVREKDESKNETHKVREVSEDRVKLRNIVKMCFNDDY